MLDAELSWIATIRKNLYAPSTGGAAEIVNDRPSEPTRAVASTFEGSFGAKNEQSSYPRKFRKSYLVRVVLIPTNIADTRY